MHAVYADTLRWRDSVVPVETNGRSRSRASLAAGSVVAVEPCLSLSDMALTAARTLIAGLPLAHTAPPDQIIVCANSFEHDLALSCACRLHHALGSNRPPFAIGQLHGVSSLMALETAIALMAADTQLSTVLIVAAERWRAPFSRRVGALAALSDGAAALLVARRPGPGWCVRRLSIQTPCVAYQPATEANYVDTVALAHAIGETCTSVELGSAELDWIVPAAINPCLIHEVSVRSALPAERIWADENAPGCLGVADLPARLDGLLHSISPVSHQHMLVWSAGFQGQVGCALLEFCGDAP
ncbi:beta-ketoacyl-[acyl-carrier-protein] synthase family protein [Burkholderia anthina]|uniref:3-oxoacyl-ACP synthase n=1 Tax=Burkholderia anthina TaxID=179879 RepID=UPI0021BBC9C3|nr:3-oxoacyl-ACP synthase [Burkholderia anthina]